MARLFNKANPDYISISGHLGDPSAISITAWIKSSTGDTDGQEIITLGDSVVLRIGSGGQLDGVYYNGSYNSLFSGTGVRDGNWHHVAYLIESGSQEIYVDGVLKASDTIVGGPNYGLGATTFIGKHFTGTTRDFNGDMAELAVWNRKLTTAEVVKLSAGNAPEFISSGLIFYIDLVSAIVDEIGAVSMTVSGTTVSTHPSINYDGVSSLLDDIVAYYKLDENTGTLVGDSIGSKNGTFNGTLGSQWAASKINSGGNFNGSNNFVAVANHPSLQLSGAFTLSAWIKLVDYNSFYTILSKFTSDASQEFHFRVEQTTGYLRCFIGSSDNTVGTHALGTGSWVHVVVTHASYNGDLILYINGSVEATGVGKTGNITTTSSFHIGQRSDSNLRFKGGIDEVGVWSRALTSTEITALYNGGAGSQYPFTLTANDTRGAVVTGKDTTFDSRGAVITGKDSTNDTRPAVTTGKETAFDDRGAVLRGYAIAYSERGAVLTGKLDRGRPTILPSVFSGTILGSRKNGTVIPGKVPTIL